MGSLQPEFALLMNEGRENHDAQPQLAPSAMGPSHHYLNLCDFRFSTFESFKISYF